ncbi:MAG: hypothetical protein IJF05_04115 [Clostridia bacterium]|nr:hypothetical protein [Clostridia bacterium]
MADTPDLSKIVGIIMEHPEIVGQISALISGTESGAESDAVTAENNGKSSESIPTGAPVRSGRTNDRARLLGAMKPYLSENRARAVDTMITVTEILESMKGGG